VLRGSVADRLAKRIAEEIAEEQSGVHDVRNEIRISGQSQSAYGQPSFSKREIER
jgi:osmotically-inducible protein OsmY